MINYLFVTKIALMLLMKQRKELQIVFGIHTLIYRGNNPNFYRNLEKTAVFQWKTNFESFEKPIRERFLNLFQDLKFSYSSLPVKTLIYS